MIMKRILLLSILATLILAAAGCGNFQQGYALSRNRALWESQNISHYRFQLQVGCFCAFMDLMPLSVEVRDGQVVSLLDASGRPVPGDRLEMLERYAGIDKLFELVDQAISGKADKVTVTYDPTYGFPTQVSIDYIKLAVDDELGLQVSNFEVLE
jgi:hypothetical protein